VLFSAPTPRQRHATLRRAFAARAIVEFVPFPWSVQLERYEGPLDLLLDLIRRQQIDIHDIPIAQITQQYFHYMEEAASLDIELSAEFVYMAATLIHIKSRTLLPRDPELKNENEPDDPREELVERLLEHERYKNAAEMLKQKRMIEENVWSNPQLKQFLAGEEDPGIEVELLDLVKALQAVVDRARTKPVYEIVNEQVTVGQMIRYVCDLFGKAQHGKPLLVVDLFEMQTSKRAMICLLLAMLEMAKAQALEIVQDESPEKVGVRKGESFDAFRGAQAALGNLDGEYN
jgi:segregation and condensation protein A